jgi:uncharacterized caspase-like protein
VARLTRLLLLATAAAVLMVGCAPRRAAELTARGLRDATSTSEQLSAALEPRRIAVLVGVDAYQHPSFPDLRFAGEDARAMAELLGSPDGGGFDRVILLNEATLTSRAAVLRELRSVREDLQRQDVFLLYFSGHGTLALDAEGGGELYLLPSDASPADLPTTALELEGLRDFLSGLRAERKALVVDACFHGDGKSVLDPGIDPPRLAELLEQTSQSSIRGLDAGEAHLFASTLGRPAFEDAELGHGVYTHYLLQSMTWGRSTADLDDDGLLTAWEAHDFARHRTAVHTSDMQVAEASLRVVGANDLLLAGDATARSDRNKALLFHYGDRGSAFAGNTLMIDGAAKGVFPGTFAVSPGRHHVEVRDEHGNLTTDGYAEFEAGQSVDARELGVLVREDRVIQAFRGGVGGGPASWGALYGDGFVAIELQTALLAPRGKARGLLGGVTLGGGFSPTRRDFDRLTRQGRGVFWLAGDVGWGRDFRRFRFRATWQVRGTLVPVARFEDGHEELQPEETGWLFLSTGPCLHLGVIVDRRLSFVAASTLQLTHLDPARTGQPKAQVFGTVTAGLEFGF